MKPRRSTLARLAAAAMLAALATTAAAQDEAAPPAAGEEADPPIEAVPVPEPRPDGDEDGAVPDEEDVPGAEPEAEPAFVSPDEARTEAEPGAPETPEAAVTPQESVEAAAAVADAMACEEELRSRGAAFTVEETISQGDCGVLRPVALTATSSGIAVEPQTLMLCRTALAFDIWVGEGFLPAAANIIPDDRPTLIRHASTYVCRDRASARGISEHARGSAIDIGSIEWKERAPIAVEAQEPGSAEDRLLAAMRRSACGPFMTVLGPGTDADHADHFHFDVAARRSGSTYCR